MIVFYADLDNTLIYSYKHEIGQDKQNVEIYQGREISFLTKRTQELLQELHSYVQIVPTTTRTDEQYNRIHLGLGSIEYALVCNGGRLLINGKNDEDWYRQSRYLIRESTDELKKAIRFLEEEKSRTMEVRLIRELFVFTKCTSPGRAADCLSEKLNLNLVDVFRNGEKVYVVPKKLNKGNAAVRFREYIGAEEVIAAGDSMFDLPMLKAADLAAVPSDYAYPKDHTLHFLQKETCCPLQKGIYQMTGSKLFSEEMLEFFLKVVKQQRQSKTN